MSSRFDKALQEAKSKMSGLGESTSAFETFVADTVLKQYAKDFVDLVRKNIKDRKVVASGQLETNIEIIPDESGNKISITMLDYFDYPNEGVRGVKFSNNAPNSPYKFKSLYTMSPEGRAKIKQLISDGKAKISDTSKTKKAVGLEGKRKSLIDMQTDQLIYLIKKHGIKRTRYFDDAFDTVFGTFAEDMAKAYGQDVAFSIQLATKKL
ncbi:MAG: hypothetical protein ACK5DE_07550 [Bacteroidota bacterium]|jgi:hypothetical protein